MSGVRSAEKCLLIAAVLASCSGCQDYPARVAAPDWQPDLLAAAAIRDFDSNGDGELDSEEISAAPGLAAGVAQLDGDKNKRITVEELQARFATYDRLAVGRTSASFRFLIGNRPLVGADIEFVPEQFLGEVIKPASATTNGEGIARPQTTEGTLPGMQVGYYRIRVTAPDGRVPAKYGDASTLGAEVSGINDDPAGYQTRTFRLDAK